MGAKEIAIVDVKTNPLRTIIIICLTLIFEPRTCWIIKKEGKQIITVERNRTMIFTPATMD